MMTKAEERKVLDKIAALIASAGEDSYIWIAFAGCVDIARDNIENDFYNSYRDRADRLERENGDLLRHIDNMGAEIRMLKKSIAQLEADAIIAERKELPVDLYSSLAGMLSGSIEREARNIAAEAENLAAFADCPEDIAVGAALKRLALAKSRRNQAAELLERLEGYWKEI